MSPQLIFSTGSEVTSGSLVVTGSLDQLDIDGFSGSFTGTFIGDGSGVTGISAETASYVAGGNVDGAVASATSASHALQADNAKAADTSVSASHALQADLADNATAAVSASHALQADGVVSGTHALNADTAVLATDAVTSLTASFVEGSNVNGPVAELSGLANLTANSDMSASQFTHERLPASGALADFTISFNDGQTQAYAISASVQFEIQDMQVGGFYIVEFENQDNHILTLPSAAPLVFHGGTPVTASLTTGSLDVYGFYHRGPNTLMTVLGEDIS